MKYIIDAILTIFAVAIFALLFLTSFFSTPQYFTVPELDVSGSGVTVYSSSGAAKDFSKHNMSLYESLYTNTSGVNFEKGSGSLVVDVSEEGKYMSSYYDISQTYRFLGKGYTLIQGGIGEVFIDSETTSGKVFIMPLNTSVKIILESEDRSEEFTEIFLYPHMYAEIAPSRGKFLKEADMIRIDTVFNIGYIGENIFSDTLSDFADKYLKTEDDFFTKTSTTIKNLQASYQKVLNIFKEQDVSILSRYEVVGRFQFLFVNNEKKKVILKNRVLGYLIDILNSQQIDESIIVKVKDELARLKNIGIQDYNEIQSLIANLVFYNNIDPRLDTAISKHMLSSLIHTPVPISEKKFLLSAYSVYSHYDNIGTFHRGFFESFVEEFRNFRPVENVTDLGGNSEYQYFSYFLEKNIIYLISQSNSDINIDFINSIVGRHLSLWAISYDSSIISRVSGIYVYSEMLKEIDTFLRSKYFLDERDNIGLLQIDASQKYDVVKMSEFSKNISDIFLLYERNEKFLDTSDLRDRSIIRNFGLLRKKLEEYFAALESYDLYVTKYDELRNEIINIGTIGSDNDTGSKLSQQDIQNYLSQFQGIDISRSLVTIVDDYYYAVDNVIIEGKSFSFDLYPDQDYKLTNIRIDNQIQNVQYKLANLESAPSEDGTGGFTAFFIDTFFAQNNENDVEEYIEDEVQVSEDRAEIVFKRDKLLGAEFKDILPVIKISYRDIKLVRKTQNYDIFISDTPIKLGGKDFKFYAQYLLTSIDHHFTDIRLISAGEITNIELQITGKVHVEDIVSIMDILDPIVSDLGAITFDLEQDYEFRGDIYVVHSSFNKKTTIKFDLQDETYTISLADSKIVSFFRGRTRLIDSPVEVYEFSQVLENYE